MGQKRSRAVLVGLSAAAGAFAAAAKTADQLIIPDQILAIGDFISYGL